MPERLGALLLPLVLFLAILGVALLFPALGILVGIFTPVPLILIYLQWGKPIGLISMGAVFLVIMSLASPQQAMIFIAEYALVALIMAETIGLSLPYDRSIFFSTLGSAALSIILIWTFVADKGMSPVDFFQEEIDRALQQYLESAKDLKDSPVDAEQMKKFASETSRMFAEAFPAIITIGALTVAVINYFSVRFLWLKFYASRYFSAVDFTRWVLPDYWVWPFIFAAGSVFWLDEAGFTVGLNAFLVLLTLFFLQGMAIVHHFLQARNVPRLLWIMIYVLIFVQPIFMGLIMGLGLSDIWLDFRKLRVTITSDPQE